MIFLLSKYFFVKLFFFFFKYKTNEVFIISWQWCNKYFHTIVLTHLVLYTLSVGWTQQHTAQLKTESLQRRKTFLWNYAKRVFFCSFSSSFFLPSFTVVLFVDETDVMYVCMCECVYVLLIFLNTGPSFVLWFFFFFFRLCSHHTVCECACVYAYSRHQSTLFFFLKCISWILLTIRNMFMNALH